MRCIFCKKDSSSSRSVEHIIPESLGNKAHILPRGIVCDKCNNYFSLKIEKPLLELPYFRDLRFDEAIKNKKGNYIPTTGVLLHPHGGPIRLDHDKNGKFIVVINEDKVSKTFKSLNRGEIIRPNFDLPDKNNKFVSRFLGKVGLERIAKEIMTSQEKLDAFIEHEDFELLRNYVRYGTIKKKHNTVWPYYLRRIYPADKKIFESGIGYQTIHEYTIFQTEQNELYVAVVIFGVEYCLNLGDPDLKGYELWLQTHNFKSPLDSEFHPEKNISTLYD